MLIFIELLTNFDRVSTGEAEAARKKRSSGTLLLTVCIPVGGRYHHMYSVPVPYIISPDMRKKFASNKKQTEDFKKKKNYCECLPT